MVPCPTCGEEIAAEATKCGYCGDSTRPVRGKRVQGDWRLKIASVLQGLIAASAAIMAPCMVFSVVVAASLPQAQQKNVLVGAIAAIGMFVAAAIFFGVTAAGAWKHRRWVRPLMLSVSVPGLAIGVVAMGVMAYTFPMTMELSQKLITQGAPGGAGAAGAPAAAFMAPVMAITLGLTFLMYVVLPGLFVGLYWSPSIQRACERANPEPCWTDRLPIPVLATSLWLGFMALGSSWFLFQNAAPAFGVLLEGWPVYAYSLALVAAFGTLSVAVYRRHPLGWWGTVTLLVIIGISHVLTYTRIDMLDLYRSAGLPEQQMRAFETMDLSRFTEAILAQGAIAILGALGFMLYLRRFFGASAGARDAETSA